MAPIITLTTDLGLNDAYVAEMKGVILGINPEVRLVDVCHTIEPQNIAQAAFVLSRAYPFFPQGTIHVVVVDPGVGTRRRAIILRTKAGSFVTPDNGVLSYVTQQSSAWEAVAITKPQLWRPTVSSTFHGRDIFAPVAAQLSLGLPLTDFGEVITSVTVLPLPQPHQAADGSMVGHVIHIDNFGNLITDINSDDLPKGKRTLTVEVGGQLISGLSRTYAEGKGLLALIGSDGYLEIAVKDGNASTILSAKVGDEVTVKRL
jgi:S-adenosylmethionine hydrolase